MKNMHLEEGIIKIQELSKKRPVKVSDLLEIFGGRGTLLLIMFLVIPFCLPIQIPGLSTPFGLAIFFICIRTAFRNKVWLTQKMRDREIKPKTIDTISDWSLWLLKKLKPLIHPRLTWFCKRLYRMHFLVMALLALILALPIPIPFSNILAAGSIFLICLGLLEDDGLIVIIGYGLGALAPLVLSYMWSFLKTQLTRIYTFYE